MDTVKITKEQQEKLIEYYDKQDHLVSLGERENMGIQEGIQETLNILGIEIEGINK